jgi:site-specific DNA recombinase
MVRCAIYTRKSTEEGLDQEFSSLDAQREAAQAYIKSQTHAGWICQGKHYDDGGFTGGNMDRPALKRILADVEAGAIDCVVVYKVDRLSRSLLDFARMMETFEKYGVSFVSVTQQFNTATSMGRLVLNVLLSFAQFEREIIAERTRDKIAAARRRGKWSGGMPLLGYDVDPRGSKLVVNPEETEQVRTIFALYLEHQGLIKVVQELERRGWRNKRWQTRKGRARGGALFTKSTLHHLLTNVVYIGKVKYKKETHRGEHTPIVNREVWHQVQKLLKRRGPVSLVRQESRAMLKGLLFCRSCGSAMTPITAQGRKGQRYYYYSCSSTVKRGRQACPAKSLPALALENWVIEQLQKLGPEVSGEEDEEPRNLVQTWVKRLEYDCAGEKLLIALNHSPAKQSAKNVCHRAALMTIPQIIEGSPEFLKLGRRHREDPCTVTIEEGRVPRITRLLALAIRFEALIREGRINNYSALARLGHVSPARVSQIANLLLLAPDIQEEILFLPRIKTGRAPIRMAQLQPIALTWDWRKQRRLWAALRASCQDSKGTSHNSLEVVSESR